MGYDSEDLHRIGHCEANVLLCENRFDLLWKRMFVLYGGFVEIIFFFFALDAGTSCGSMLQGMWKVFAPLRMNRMCVCTVSILTA